MAIGAYVQAAVEAYEKYKDYERAENFLAWQDDVSSALTGISAQLTAISAAIEKLQESINQLPGRIEEMLKDSNVGDVKGWTLEALDQVRSIRSTGGDFDPKRVPALWTLASNLGAREAALESKWGYSVYGVVTLSFLARVGLYRTLCVKDKAGAKSAFTVAKERKLAWLNAGVDASDGATGPGKQLNDRREWLQMAGAVFEHLESRRAMRIGWLEFDGTNRFSATGDAANSHVKISQPRLAGDRSSGFNALDGWEMDSVKLAGPTPNWADFVDNPWWPARRLNPMYGGHIRDIGFAARNDCLAALDGARPQYKLFDHSVPIIRAVVEELRGIAACVQRLSIA